MSQAPDVEVPEVGSGEPDNSSTPMKFKDNHTGTSPRRVLTLDLGNATASNMASSRAVKDLQRFDRHSAAGVERVAAAVLRGVQRYRKERAKAVKPNNAGLRKVPLHMARGMVTGLKGLDGLSKDAEHALLSPKLRAKLKKRLRA